MQTRTILVADDAPFVVKVFTHVLEEAGYNVVAAEDGIEAIEKIYEHDPDLVLLDLNMPRMNGYQVCRLIKADPRTRDMPVVILTSSAEKGDRYWGIASGADEYLTKDVDADVVVARIQEHLSDAPASRQPPPRAKPSELEILQQVNDLLDRKLFQLIILEELAELGRERMNLGDAINRIGDLLENILDYGCFLLHLRDAPEHELVAYCPRPLPHDCPPPQLQTLARSFFVESSLPADVEPLWVFGCDDPKPIPTGGKLGYQSPILVRSRSIGHIGVIIDGSSERVAGLGKILDLFVFGMGLVLDNILHSEQVALG